MASVFIYNKTGLQIEAMPENVLTDEKWFLFVLEQVLGNAVKYTCLLYTSLRRGQEPVLQNNQL